MMRRGFIFGAAATLVVVASPRLMRVSSRLLTPEPQQPVVTLLPGGWLFQIIEDVAEVTIVDSPPVHINCRCTLDADRFIAALTRAVAEVSQVPERMLLLSQAAA